MTSPSRVLFFMLLCPTGWHEVSHSAMGLRWGAEGRTDHKYGSTDKKTQNLQLWADWFTILLAKQVYHSHSDFSISALHFVGATNSQVFVGYDSATRQVVMSNEAYIVDGETAPLVARTKHASGTSQLRLCDDEHGIGGDNNNDY